MSARPEDVLVISAIGYETKEVPVCGPLCAGYGGGCSDGASLLEEVARLPQ